MSKLFGYAGNFRYLTICSWVLSAISALMALLPFVYIWKVLQEVIRVAPDFDMAQNLAYNGWMAVLFAVLSMAIYIGALMCSHIAAFRVQANIRSQAMHHIATLPLGFMDGIGSGKLRKIVDESSAATETYLAHTGGAALFASLFRLAAGVVEPHSRRRRLCHHGDDDRSQNAAENGGVSGISGSNVQRGSGVRPGYPGCQNLWPVGVFL